MADKSFLVQKFAKLPLNAVHVVGYSVAGEETVCQIPELNVCFDIGRCPHFALTSDIVCITHGHMDHIGALPYLLREFDGDPIPVYGTAFTLALLEGQLEEHQVRDRAEFRQVTPGEAAVAGPFSMRFLRVTHSIPDGMAVVIETPYGSILHTGDFKIDQTPLDGRATDLHALAEEAGRGVHLLMSDSTNAEESGYTDSERSVGPVLQDIISRAPQLVVVACFSSHIHRIQQVVNAARSDERVVAFLGRSMLQSVEAARELGIEWRSSAETLAETIAGARAQGLI